jgi:hypothetical protein
MISSIYSNHCFLGLIFKIGMASCNRPIMKTSYVWTSAMQKFSRCMCPLFDQLWKLKNKLKEKAEIMSNQPRKNFSSKTPGGGLGSFVFKDAFSIIGSEMFRALTTEFDEKNKSSLQNGGRAKLIQELMNELKKSS